MCNIYNGNKLLFDEFALSNRHLREIYKSRIYFTN